MPTQHHYISNTLAKKHNTTAIATATQQQASVHKEQTHSLFETRNHHTKIISDKPLKQFR